MNRPIRDPSVKKLNTTSYTLGGLTIKSRVNQETGETYWDLFNNDFGDFISMGPEDLNDLRDVLTEMRKDRII